MTVDPPSQSVEITHTVKFTTTVSGVGKDNFSYQWRHNGVDIDGEISDTFAIASVGKGDGGNYTCTVWNNFGDSASDCSELSKLVYVVKTHNRLIQEAR